MSKPQLPEQEAARLDALYQYEILDTPCEAVFDDIAYLAAQISNTPIALINFIDRNRQWFKASIAWTIPELPRNIGFCAHTILQPELLIVPDACQDSRFANNLLVTREPHIRFYAGVPLITPTGQIIGTLCVMDQRSRTQEPNLAEVLSTLGRQVVSHLESRQQLLYSARVIAEYQRTQAALQQSEDGTVNQVSCTFSDITERQRAEEELRSSEERFRQLAENLHQIFWMSSADMKQILYISPAYEEILQRTCASLYQQPDSWLDAIHPLDLEYVLAAIEEQMRTDSRYDVEYRIVRGDGIRWLWARIFPVRNFEGAIYRFAGIAEDITERKQTEHQIQASLKEKEVLLQEIHHRVKNNLQVISSLLNLQSGYIKDQQAIESFKESQNRIKSMALIHENLYQVNNLSQINFAEYVQQLVVNLFRVYGVNSAVISLKVDVEDVLLGVDTAISCGLIINELASNTIKHAFPSGKSGEICILLIRVPNQDNKLILTVRDNGIGFPKNIDVRKPKSLGLQLVNTLAAQMKGTVELNCNGITEFNIEFRVTAVQ